MMIQQFFLSLFFLPLTFHKINLLIFLVLLWLTLHFLFQFFTQGYSSFFLHSILFFTLLHDFLFSLSDFQVSPLLFLRSVSIFWFHYFRVLLSFLFHLWRMKGSLNFIFSCLFSRLYSFRPKILLFWFPSAADSQ